MPAKTVSANDLAAGAPIVCATPDAPCDHSGAGALEGTCAPLVVGQLGVAVGFPANFPGAPDDGVCLQ